MAVSTCHMFQSSLYINLTPWYILSVCPSKVRKRVLRIYGRNIFARTSNGVGYIPQNNIITCLFTRGESRISTYYGLETPVLLRHNHQLLHARSSVTGTFHGFVSIIITTIKILYSSIWQSNHYSDKMKPLSLNE